MQRYTCVNLLLKVQRYRNRKVIAMSDVLPLPDDEYPIDTLENLAVLRDWDHNRFHEDKIVIQKKASWETYSVYASEEDSIVKIECYVGHEFGKFAELEFLRLLNLINSRLGTGAFNYCDKQNNLTYKTEIDFDDNRPLTEDDIEFKVLSVIAVMDRFYPSFMVVSGVKNNFIERTKKNVCCLNPAMTAADAFQLALEEAYGTA